MPKYRASLMVCAGAGCEACGCIKIKNALIEELKKRALEKEIGVVLTGCMGPCQNAPIILVYPEKIFYQKVKLEDIPLLVEEHFLKGRPVERLMYQESETKIAVPVMGNIPFFKHQVLRVLRNKGMIDPEKIEEYIARDGYQATAQALLEMTPKEITKVVKDSEIRGRGGAGFPTGVKWESCAKMAADQKYMCCNGDEGDPGAFMDRALMESDPHAVIEGMIIGAKAIGATKGYIYVRAEYPLAIHRLKIAIDQAYEAGLLGKNILDSGTDFDLEIYQGAGAFVCGESTALMFSIEGKRGMPRLTPPRSTEAGLWGKPTVLNNVETLACVPQIILKGADWFKSMGTEKSTGTKVFSLSGAINNAGLVEVPMGIPLRTIIYDIGGGIPGAKRGRKFKAVQMGGPSGGCIPESMIDTPVTYEDIEKTGAIMGSGGMVFMDNTTCMVGMAKFFLEFTTDESCGKCPPCRIGTKIMLDLLTAITEGRGKEGDIETLEELSHDIIDGSLCGLGQSAPNPVLTTIRYFHKEYESHIKDKWCKVGVCRNLCTFLINPEVCTGCGACMRACPSKAIIGEKKKPHKIIQEACVQCKTCYDTCKFNSIIIGPAQYKGEPAALVKS